MHPLTLTASVPPNPMNTRQLYQEVILDHNRKPRNWGTLANATHHAEGVNPLCGDRLQLAIKVDDGAVQSIAFEGESCAICLLASNARFCRGIRSTPHSIRSHRPPRKPMAIPCTNRRRAASPDISHAQDLRNRTDPESERDEVRPQGAAYLGNHALV